MVRWIGFVMFLLGVFFIGDFVFTREYPVAVPLGMISLLLGGFMYWFGGVLRRAAEAEGRSHHGA